MRLEPIRSLTRERKQSDYRDYPHRNSGARQYCADYYLNGANPTTVECHTGFTDPGATAHDACAGDFAAQLQAQSIRIQWAIRHHLQRHRSIRSRGTPVTRTVNVVDTTVPTVTPHQTSTLILAQALLHVAPWSATRRWVQPMQVTLAQEPYL
jgi:hypothetical protein